VIVEFVVLGDPKTKGSMRTRRTKDGKHRVVNSSSRTSDWQELVAWHARLAMRGRQRIESGPVSVVALFALPMPKAPKHRSAISMRDGDLDKLQRCVGDALTGIVYSDDSRVISWQAEKFYADGIPPGVFVRVEKLREYQYEGSIGWYRNHLERNT
jgi:Holliday junction resolvase RusA-like endonuclease